MTVSLELDDIQGLVVRGFGTLPSARFLLLSIDEPAAARRALARVLPKVTPGGDRPVEDAMNVALTADGLRRLGVSTEPESGFAPEFAAGLTDSHRSRLLGDVDANAPARWDWGGPGNPPVHVAVLTWARTPARLDRLTTALRKDLVGRGFTETISLETTTRADREPFGFADGISQPVIEGLPAAAADPAAVRAGEFLLGYSNEYGQFTDVPALPGQPDFGRNGTYLVLRQLRQDVEAFNDYLEGVTRRPDGQPDPARQALVAAKIVGRWPSGAPLVLSPYADDEEQAKRNDFGYRDTDPQGLHCPIGAHIRRANPRDSLNPELSRARAEELNRRHRLLRRGRSYGSGPGQEVGLHFLCVGTSLSRQFEFVQHTWLNNPNFDGLYGDPDPLVGPRLGRADFTEQALPVRRRYRDLPEFVTTRGGAYFFLPGLRALRALTVLQ